jgi:exosortase H (IPTLxxWG-CTERM-specific)
MVGMDPNARRRLGFALRFLGTLVLLYVVIALNQVNDGVIVPFTEGVTAAAGAVLRAAGEPNRVAGTVIASPAFAIDVKNGCNAVETMMLFAAAVIAFPAPFKRKLLALALGLPLIQLLNVLRLAMLFWLGVHHRQLFDVFHVAVWQAVMILAGVAIFASWSSRIAPRPAADLR